MYSIDFIPLSSAVCRIRLIVFFYIFFIGFIYLSISFGQNLECDGVLLVMAVNSEASLAGQSHYHRPHSVPCGRIEFSAWAGGVFGERDSMGWIFR